MLVIRLFRVGKKNQPSFKVVVTDKRNPPRGGRFLEEVGFYNPLTKEKILKKERIQYWMSQGVKPSPTVFNFLIKEGILEGKKIPVHKKSKKEKPIVVPAEAPKAEAKPKEEEPKPAESKSIQPAGEEPKKEEKKEEIPQEGKTEEKPKSEQK